MEHQEKGDGLESSKNAPARNETELAAKAKERPKKVTMRMAKYVNPCLNHKSHALFFRGTVFTIYFFATPLCVCVCVCA